jgi:hypothetical protein
MFLKNLYDKFGLSFHLCLKKSIYKAEKSNPELISSFRINKLYNFYFKIIQLSTLKMHAFLKKGGNFN